MIGICKRIYRVCLLFKITKSIRLILLLSTFRGLDLSRIQVSSKSKVFIKGTHLDLGLSSRHFLLEGFPLLISLLDCCKAKIFADENGSVIMRVSEVSFYLRNWQELFIAHEVFVGGCYNILLKQPFFLIDIGFNVGLASLFFASHINCVRIQAFEPFPATFEAGAMNIDLNPQLKQKFCLHNYGLAGSERNLVLDYCAEIKGSIGLCGISPLAKSKDFLKTVSLVEIQVKDVATELKRVLGKTTGEKVICKIDCEGSEYEILPRLDAENILGLVDIYLVEWHLQGPKQLEEIFSKNGFSCLSLNPVTEKHGMLYAFK